MISSFLVLIFLGFSLAGVFCQEGERKKFGPKEFKMLIESQDKIKEKVREYIKMEEKRLDEIRKLLEEPNEPAPKGGYSNPLVNFRIVKKFVRSEMFEKMRISPVDEILKDFTLPDYWDMEKVGTSVIKMMDKKKLTAKDMADGAPESPLTFEECFHIGRMAYNVQDYYHAALWMEETWNRMQGQSDVTNKDKIPVLDFWSFSLYQEGNLQRSWWLTKQILKFDPENKRFAENLPLYEEEMKEKKLKVPESEKDLPPITYSSLEQEKKAKGKKEL